VKADTVSTYMPSDTASAAFSRTSFSSCGTKLVVEQMAAPTPAACMRKGP
jgi:hypothetical protein